MANAFVNEARRNFHSFENQEELQQCLINNYPAVIVPDTLVPTYYFYKSTV